MEELKINEPKTIRVDSINPWFPSGFMLHKDCVYKFEVIPDTQTWWDGHRLDPFTADGRPTPI